MDFFDQDVSKLSAWQLPWALAWPNDEWHKKMLDKGLVPALGGYDIEALRKSLENGEASLEDLKNKSLRLILGLVRQNIDSPKTADDNALEELLQALRHDEGKQPAFDEDKSEILIPGTPNIRMYIGLHRGDLWPASLEEPSAFVVDDQGKSDGEETSLVYYSDKEQKVHVRKGEELDVYQDGGFMASYPSALCGENTAVWGVLKARSE